MRKCPNADCKNIGFIKLQSCRENLKCDLCTYEWRDPALYSKSENLSKCLRKACKLDFQFLTQLRNLLFEEPCP